MKIIFFDFDGVIADSFDAAFQTNKELNPDIEEHEYRSMFSGNINEAFKKRDEAKKTKSKEKEYFELYSPRLLASRIFPGMTDVIRHLAQEYTLAIVSSTISSPIAEYCSLHGIDRYFSDIMGNDVHHSKHEKIKMVLNKHRIVPMDSLFITDTLGDAHEAKVAGVETIGVTWGYQKRESLAQERFFAIVETPEELSKAVTNYFPIS